MTSLRLFSAALLASTMLISCNGGAGHVDSRYPSVSQQDAYDVSWGLAPRKSRGNPKMRYQYNAREEIPQPAAAAPAAPAPAPVPAPPRSAAPSPAPISPTIPSNLR